MAVVLCHLSRAAHAILPGPHTVSREGSSSHRPLLWRAPSARDPLSRQRPDIPVAALAVGPSGSSGLSPRRDSSALRLWVGGENLWVRETEKLNTDVGLVGPWLSLLRLGGECRALCPGQQRADVQSAAAGTRGHPRHRPVCS